MYNIDVIKHRELKDLFFQNGGFLSEFSFANCYLFRNQHRYQLVESRYGPLLSGMSYDKKSYILLSSPPERYPEDYLQQLLLEKEMIFPVPEQWIGFFQKDRYKIDYREEDSDYLISVQKTADYNGKKLQKKKNLLNQFLREYNGTMLTLDKSKVPLAEEILEIWQQNSGQEKRETDYFPCRDALIFKKELDLQGCLFWADNKPAGFMLYEQLNARTLVIHFAKALIEFKGIYQFMFNHLARYFSGVYEYFNLEQDLGSPSLRQTKRSYAPELMLKKYRVSLAE